MNGGNAMPQSGCLANTMDAPPGFEPLRLLADEVMGELARAYQFIRTRADAYATELAVVASERERLERDRAEVTRQREELVRQARSAGVIADVSHSSRVEPPKLACQPPIEQPMPAQVAPALSGSGKPTSTSPSADQFRKLRRDAKRRVKGLS